MNRLSASASYSIRCWLMAAGRTPIDKEINNVMETRDTLKDGEVN